MQRPAAVGGADGEEEAWKGNRGKLNRGAWASEGNVAGGPESWQMATGCCSLTGTAEI